MIYVVLSLICFGIAIAALRLGQQVPTYRPALESLAGFLIIAGLATLGFGLGAFERMVAGVPAIHEH